MTNHVSIPSLRDLPAGRLGQRKEHLLAEITREHRPAVWRPKFAMPRLRVALVAAAFAVVALAPLDGGRPLGGSAFAAIKGKVTSLSELWIPGTEPPAPPPYQPGDKIITTPSAPSGPSEFEPTAPRPYQPGDTVWKSAPPAPTTAPLQINCDGTDSRARLKAADDALSRLQRAGPSVSSVVCK